MTRPLARREVLRGVAATTLASGLVGWPVSAAQARQAAGFSRDLPGGAWHYPAREELLPFGHAVASGDPLHDRVVLWTRITIPDARGWDTRLVPDPQGLPEVTVEWVIATDPALTQVVNRGTVTTDATRDFTVKVDADGLQSATTHWYAFTALGYRSPIGRTRTAPKAGDGITELTVAHVSCTNWWADVLNGYARAGERPDIDLITHAGDHVYEVSGNHMSSRQYPGPDGSPQVRPYEDIDNRTWRNVGECRRRYALYYQDLNLVTAHVGAAFAIMADQHDYEDNEFDADGDGTIVDGERVTRQQAGETMYEWSPIRPPLPDGSGRFRTVADQRDASGQVLVPRGDDAFFSYRTLDYGDVAEVILIDVRRHRDDEAEMTILGDRQWQWLQETLSASKARGTRHNLIVNQLNMSQFRAVIPPAYGLYAEAFADAFGQDPTLGTPVIEFDWDLRPDDRRLLYRFLRDEGILDNIVLSGDSHGWFGSDLTEDPTLPNYVPLTGASPLQPVGVEMVGTSMGRPGAQDVVADELYWGANGGRQSAPFDDAAAYDSQYRTAALPAAIAIEEAAKQANRNLIYFNWKAEYGHAMIHLRPDEAVIENWVSPQRKVAAAADLVAQHTSPIGNPHLVPVLQPQPVNGQRSDAFVDPETVPVPRPAPAPSPAPAAPLPVTGGGMALLGAGAIAAAALLRRRGRP